MRLPMGVFLIYIQWFASAFIFGMIDDGADSTVHMGSNNVAIKRFHGTPMIQKSFVSP